MMASQAGLCAKQYWYFVIIIDVWAVSQVHGCKFIWHKSSYNSTESPMGFLVPYWYVVIFKLQ